MTRWYYFESQYVSYDNDLKRKAHKEDAHEVVVQCAPCVEEDVSEPDEEARPRPYLEADCVLLIVVRQPRRHRIFPNTT